MAGSRMAIVSTRKGTGNWGIRAVVGYAISQSSLVWGRWAEGSSKTGPEKVAVGDVNQA